jgi:competence protein ComEA
MKYLKRWIEDVFGFSPRETKGFFTLVIIILICILLPHLIKIIFPATSASGFSDKKELDSLYATLQFNKAEVKTEPVKTSAVINFHSFDPNTESEEGFVANGISPQIAKRIINFRNKGGKFKIRADLKKIYGFPEDLYNQVYPFINLPEVRQKYEQATLGKKENPRPELNSAFQKFDINLADSLQLTSIKGIGVKLSSRILKYRNRLGGFISPDQLKEVYGLDSIVIEELNKSTFISEDFKPATINVNTATYDQLKAHPYSNPKLSRLIVAYRSQHGVYKSTESLKSILGISFVELNKLYPYLSVE